MATCMALQFLLMHNICAPNQQMTHRVFTYQCTEKEMVKLPKVTVLDSNPYNWQSSLPATVHDDGTESTIICEDESKDIKCPKGRSIMIIDALYGRTDCNTCVHSMIKDTNCRANNSRDIVSARCNHKEYCTLEAKNSWFSDPCVGTHKYLQIEYQCLTVHGDGTESTIICENESKDIKCPKGKSIMITDALYGRTDRNTCVHSLMKDTNCRANNSLDIVSGRCNNIEYCTLKANNNWFSDPCVGTYKYLKAEYQCLEGNELIKISPGAPSIVDLTVNSVTYHVDGLNKTSSKLYKVQLKDTLEDLWVDVFESNSCDLSKDQSVRGLKPGKAYDLRVIIRNFIYKAICIPFTRFITKDL